MTKQAPSVPPFVAVDARLAKPLHRQLYDGLRGAVLSGRLAPGARLPSTRTLASELRVSRNTAMNAYLQLLAEGYLEGRVGSGTFVARVLPDDLLGSRAAGRGSDLPAASAAGGLSRRGELLARTRTSTVGDLGKPRALRPGVPALEEFPVETWRRILSRVWRQAEGTMLGYGYPAGYPPLREEITAYLGASRAVRCEPEQVIVVSGSQQALDLCARVLLDPGDAAWVEDPGYGGARAALLGSGARLVPVPVDEWGLDVAAGRELAPEARLACVTPSHQFPTGATMSLSRRLELLAWAGEVGGWVVEDDYDSEYRYTGRPLEALQGLDGGGHVVYVGTFSKVLFPSLRLGYLVVPPGLVDAFVSARELVDRQPPGVEQAVLARFMAEGHFARHVRRMRALYAARRQALLEAAAQHLEGALRVRAAEAGMHLVGELPEGVDDRRASRLALEAGVEAPAVSVYGGPGHGRGSGLMLGYAAVPEAEIQAAVRRLAGVLLPTKRC
jgi:GntR family transcriptional regulator / MocR family aminotransferase